MPHWDGQVLPEFDGDGALFSPCRRYRYLLWRRWSSAPPLVFVCLNPSTADEQNNDPTNRRTIGFARALGFGGMVMANLYAYRATQPKDLFRAMDPVGADNDQILAALGNAGLTLVAGWGNHGHRPERLAQIRSLSFSALRVNGTGAPAHPLYLPKDLGLQPYAIDQGMLSPMR